MTNSLENTQVVAVRPRELQPGKGSDGRFLRGNKLGRGNPLAGRAAKIRAILLRKVTPKVAGEVADRLIEQAKLGDKDARKELLDRTIGKAIATELLERIEALEHRLSGQDQP